MACNLNFNQCNLSSSFPRPIFNCRCRLVNLLNSSNLSVVNPVVDTSLALTTLPNQTVLSNGIVSSNISFLRGNSISLQNNGSFALTEGQYLVSYAVSGTIPSNGTFAFAIDQDGFIIPGSESSMSGISGTSANVTNSAIINVTSVSSLISIKNTISQPQTITGGNITIQKL